MHSLRTTQHTPHTQHRISMLYTRSNAVYYIGPAYILLSIARFLSDSGHVAVRRLSGNVDVSFGHIEHSMLCCAM